MQFYAEEKKERGSKIEEIENNAWRNVCEGQLTCVGFPWLYGLNGHTWERGQKEKRQVGITPATLGVVLHATPLQMAFLLVQYLFFFFRF